MNMRRRFSWLSLLLLASLGGSAGAVDHNNIDAGRPLNFDDAEALAYRERAIEIGAAGISPHGRQGGLGMSAEFLYGFALNTHASLDLDAATGGRAGSREEGFETESVSLGLLHNFNREYNDVPAFGLRGDVAFPTEEGAQGVEVRVRGILSKILVQYDRIHLNLDGILTSEPEEDERRIRPAVLLGYSKPLGYPIGFNRTGAAEVSLRTPEQKGTGLVTTLGLGLRQQITVRSVVDLGVQSDVGVSRGAPHDDVRVVAGYSVGF
jgi:hypothetical protein